MSAKLLHIIPFAHLGGTEKDCYYVIKSDKENEHIVFVLDAPGPMCFNWEAEGAKVICLNILQLPNNELVKNLEEKLYNSQFIGIFYWSTIKLPLIRYVLRKHSCRLAVHVGNPCQLTVTSTIKQLLFHFLKPSKIETCLFACSEHVRKTLVINSYYKLFETRVSLNPVELLSENPYIAREILTDSEIIIGMTARLDPIKDHETVIRAFSIVQRDYPNAKLWLLGDGVLRETLEELTRNLKISQHVIFWGNVTNVYELVQKMDLFVYATTLKEGLGNAVSEAMANGLPCIITDLPMMKEIAGEENNVLYFENSNYLQLAEMVITTIKNQEIRKEISEKVFKRTINAFSEKIYRQSRYDFLLA